MERNNSFGITALVLGICGIFFLPILLGILAIIFGSIGISRNQKYAKAGLILGILDLIIGIIFAVLILSFIAAFLAAF